MNPDAIFRKALQLEPLTAGEGLWLWRNTPLPELMMAASAVRQLHQPGNHAGWMIDRNVNITNICFSQCTFCNFCRRSSDADAYVTTIEEYRKKIAGLFEMGGDQLLLQGGMHPLLGLDFYTSLFRNLKGEFPNLKLHALGPPEIVWLARKEKSDFRTILEALAASGLDSLPGAGAEILVDRVRKAVSPAKATTAEWLGVMREAHKMNLPTSATMMFGHMETEEERIEHLVLLRRLQEERPDGHYGFITFVPWPFMDKGTVLAEKMGIRNIITTSDYLRLIAVSRLMLNNIPNIQASLLTVGEPAAMLSLHAGANDLGSIMIEENVVSSAGAVFRVDATKIKQIIRDAGFTPRRRNQKYEPVE
ncbi:MAG: CofH family radical SAM protein [Bacteroidetes bacterium]|nr:CofH family radical SAM protein [Bacteroidota bacterium]